MIQIGPYLYIEKCNLIDREGIEKVSRRCRVLNLDRLRRCRELDRGGIDGKKQAQ